jgi:diamine N-acetyltransferase
MTIRHATLDDVPALSAFGRRVYHATFAPDNRPDDLAAYLDGAYTEHHQRQELADPTLTTLLVEHEGALAAFAQLRPGTEAGVTGPDPLELWRFYVDPAWHGHGIAAALMAAAEQAALARGGRTLWLGVWERNPRAQAFYRKQGFVVVGEHIFMLGSDPQRDLIMEKRALGGG